MFSLQLEQLEVHLHLSHYFIPPGKLNKMKFSQLAITSKIFVHSDLHTCMKLITGVLAEMI